MGLGGVLNVANSGLAVTQSGLDVVARNIANVDTEGYTRKSLDQENIYTPDGGRGVRVIDVSRDVDSFVQERLRVQTSTLSGLDVRKDFLARLDQLFGEPGGAASLDTIVNNFTQSIQDMIASPESYASRESVVGDAQLLAQEIRTLSEQVQSLRQLAEDEIATSVSEINSLLSQLTEINGQLSSYGSGTPPADSLDQRDKLISRLSELMEVSVVEKSDNSVTIRTAGGETLLDGNGVNLSFDHQGNIGPHTLYNVDKSLRDVGTITIDSGSGLGIDLIATGTLGEGRIGTLVELRDEILSRAQDQLDELAHGLALSFSDKIDQGTTATSGAQTGLEVDLSGIQPGNEISITYTQGSVERQVTFVRVDDASQLPLDNDVTPNPDDVVYGIDFSSGYASAIADINTILTGTLGANVTVSSPSGNILQVLDDGATNTSDVNALSVRITSTATQDDGLQIALFTDTGETHPQAYSGSLDGGSQKLGFASRITVNAAIIANNELLVRHSSSPETPLGDQSRPQEIYARIAESDFTFSSDSGIGESDNPYSGSIVSYAQRIVSYQTALSDRADRQYAAQEVVTSALREQFSASVKVDVDEELANLISLQNSFAANARVIQTASELMDILLQL